MGTSSQDTKTLKSDWRDATPEEMESLERQGLLRDEEIPPPSPPPKRTLGQKVTTGLLPTETITKSLFRMTPQELRQFGQEAPTLTETPGRAAARAGLSGAAADISELLSGFTSPLSIATLGLGKLAQVPGTVSRLAKGLLIGGGVPLGVTGAEQVSEAISETEASLPERIQQGLTGGAQVLGATPAAALLGTKTLNLGTRIRNLGRTSSVEQTKALTATLKSTGNLDVVADVVEPALPVLRQTALDMKLDPNKSFKGPQGVKNYEKVVLASKKKVQAQFEGALKQVEKDTLSGNSIQKAIYEFLKTDTGAELMKNSPKAAKAYIKEAQNWAVERDPRTGQFKQKVQSVRMWDESRRRLFQEIKSLELAPGGKAIQVLRTRADIAAKKLALDAIRDLVYDHVQTKTGIDVGGLKSTERALIHLEEFAGKFSNQTQVQQAKFDTSGFFGQVKKSLGAGIAFRNIWRVPTFRAIVGEVFMSPETQAGEILRKGFTRAPVKRTLRPSPRIDSEAARNALLLQLIAESQQEPK